MNFAKRLHKSNLFILHLFIKKSIQTLNSFLIRTTTRGTDSSDEACL